MRAWIILAAAFCFILSNLAAGFTELQSELIESQQKAPDGVIAFTLAEFEKFTGAKSRPYSLVFLLLSSKLMDRPKLALRQLRKEFGLAANAYKQKYPAESNRAGKVFFVTVQLEDSPEVFQRFQAASLPFVCRIPPHMVIKGGETLDIPPEEKMAFDRYPSYPWRAEDFADFIKKRTGVAVEEIVREDFMSSRLSLLLIFVFIGTTSWTTIRVYNSPLLRNKWIWMIGSVFVCWFSTSGMMFNIIRGVPMAIPRDGKLQLLYPGSNSQLGAEGFGMGALYVLFSSALVAMTYGAPKIANPSFRRLLVLACIIAMVLLLRQIVFIYKMKTGYHIQQYMF